MVTRSGLALVCFLAACTQRGIILELEPGAEDAAPARDLDVHADEAPSVIPEAAADAPRLGLAVVLVDAKNPVHANDAVLEDRIRQIGFTVEERSYVDPIDAGQGIAVVVLSSTLLAGELDARLPDQPIPMVVLEAFSYNRLGMTDLAQGGDFGAIDGTSIDVVPGPFASGSAGNVIVHMPASAINYGRPSPDAIIGARLPGVADAASTFGYEKGAAMFGRTAAARRVGVFLRTGTIGSLTPSAWDLFNAAVRWAAQ
jgi:hypothetical protein